MTDGWGAVIPTEGNGGAFKWARIPRSGRLDVVVASDGWLWYHAHFVGVNYARCLGNDCPWCGRGFPRMNRMIMPVFRVDKPGQWAIEIPESAGATVQGIAGDRKGIGGVLLSFRRDGAAGRGTIEVRDLDPTMPKNRDRVSADVFLAWVQKQNFWMGWTGPHSNETLIPEEEGSTASAGT